MGQLLRQFICVRARSRSNPASIVSFTPVCPATSRDSFAAYQVCLQSVASNARTRVASMPTPRSGLAAALGRDGRIYAIGGGAPGVRYGATPLLTGPKAHRR